MKLKLILCYLLASYSVVFGQVGFQTHTVVDNIYYTAGVFSVITADINGDGDMDVLSASYDRIAWYENKDGLGDFDFQHIIADGDEIQKAVSVFAADMDGDGDMDVLFASRTNHKIAWYENIDGQGNFGGQQIISIIAYEAESVSAADMDGDGDIDVLSASFNDDKIAWYENMDGQGSFGEPQIITTNANGAYSVFTADIDNDGDLDVLSASINDDKIAWYENIDGQGNFGSPQIITTNALGARTVFAIDIDNDGDMDVLSASYDDDKIAWYENLDGQGDFSNPQIISLSADGARGVFAADIDNDGDMDVLSASSDDNKLAWYENIDGQGDFSDQQIIFTGNDAVFSVFAGDIDGDGAVDILTASGVHNNIAWYKNINGLGEFGVVNDILINSIHPVPVSSADIDGDGDLDIVTASHGDSEISWFENIDGTGQFYGNQHIVSSYAYVINTLFLEDLDGDGDIDILTPGNNDNAIVWYENLDGLGNFGTAKVISVTGDSSYGVHAADLDGDGDMDVLSAVYTEEKIAWYENDGQGNFTDQQIISLAAAEAVSVFANDIDNDGDMDVLAMSGALTNPTLAWYENMDGQGNFGSEQIISSGLGSWYSYADDIDGDGDIDLLSKTADDNVVWFENTDGQGSFDTHILPSVLEVRAVRLADLDGDGDRDILANGAELIGWFENVDGLGNFDDFQEITSTIDQSSSLHVADFNNDGVDDFVTSIKNESKIIWFENIGSAPYKINGTVSIDYDANGCDSSDELVGDLMIFTDNGTNNFSSFTQENGMYAMNVNEGNFNTSVTSSLPNYYTALPATYSSTINATNVIDTVNFCIAPNQIFNDLTITLIPLQSPRPGFNNNYQLIYKNEGTTTLSGTVSIEFDDSKLNFLNASEPITSQTNNTLTFSYQDLKPFEKRKINLGFYVYEPPTVNIDEVLNFTASIYPITGDENEENNIYSLNKTVIGSYDPNDITVLEGEELLVENTDKYLHYVIRFQNTGTAEAINVRVENSLDPNLDPQSLQLESLSHPYRVEIKDGTEVSFIFDNINLPDSTNNEPASHGFIAYKIKPKVDIALGDIIYNKADIFFDFNPAIETNTVFTEVIAEPSYGIDYQTSCEPFTWIDGNTYTMSNDTSIYVLTGAAMNGGDSIVTLNLIIYEVDTTVSVNNNVITSNATNAFYQWIDCSDNSIIVGETNISFTATQNGSYAVEVTQNNCTQISECIDIVMSNIEKPHSLEDFSVYPIPTTAILKIDSKTKIAQVEIYNILNQLALKTGNSINTTEARINISKLNNGSYFCKVIDENGLVGIKKIIKE